MNKINYKKLKALAKVKEWQEVESDYDEWSGYEYDLALKSNPKIKISNNMISIEGTADCCGIQELSTYELSDIYGQTPKKYHKQIFAYALLDALNSHNAYGLIFFGAPVSRKGEGRSSYDFQFYKDFIPFLESVGFERVTTRPAFNRNSGNNIHMLVGKP